MSFTFGYVPPVCAAATSVDDSEAEAIIGLTSAAYIAKFGLDDDLSDEIDEEMARVTSVWRNVFGRVSSRELISSHDQDDCKQFFNLITQLGTTYCDEDHAPILRALLVEGNILPRLSFESWYIGWLFDNGSECGSDGGDGEGNDGCDDMGDIFSSLSLAAKGTGTGDHNNTKDAAATVNATDNTSSSSSSSGSGSSWGGVKWTQQPASACGEGQWKCSVCLILNSGASFKCVACETDGPNTPPPAAVTASAAAAAVGGGSSGGFTFGYTPPPVPFAANAATVFSFGYVPPVCAAATSVDDSEAEAIIGLTSAAYIAKFGLDDDLSDEIDEEMARVTSVWRNVFGRVSSRELISSHDQDDCKQFFNLITQLGTTYCDEDHAPILRALLVEGNILPRLSFESWYIGWLFDNGSECGSDGGDGEGNDGCDDMGDIFSSLSLAAKGTGTGDHNNTKDAAATVNATDNTSSSSSSSGSGSSWGGVKWTQQPASACGEGQWKCSVCLILNSGASFKCVACETDGPNTPPPSAVTAPAAAAVTAAVSGGSSGGFTFGFTAPPATSIVPSSVGSSSSSITNVGGFSFGFIPPSSTS